jgi:hypothetical protein
VTEGASASETLWIALAGGAIGVLLTGAAWLLVKLLAIPGVLREHDFEVGILNEDLELWAVDEYRRVIREFRKIENAPHRSADWIYSGAYGNARSAVKTDALHRWRDRLHRTERDLIAIKAKETAIHRLIRHRKRYRHGLDFYARERVEPIIEELRQPVTKHGADHLKVFDPTRLRLEDLIHQIKENPLEPEESPRVEYRSDGAGGHTRHVHNQPPPTPEDIPGYSGPLNGE